MWGTWLIATQTWNAIDQTVLDPLTDTMPHRVEGIQQADGRYTEY